jgi:DegV family protein with EDD domain
MTRLTLENTALVADSTCDPPAGYFDRPGLAIVPLKVNFGDESFRDMVDLSSAEFFARLATSPVLPTTSQPTEAEFESCYAHLLERYERVVSFHLPREMSGTFQVAATVAERLPGVTAYDARIVSTPITMIVDRVRARLEEGIEEEALHEYIRYAIGNARLIFQVETLEYLRRGGRIGRASSIVGDVLGIRPLIHSEDGVLAPYAKVRGEKRALDLMVGYLEKYSAPDDAVFLALFHAEKPEALPALRERLLAVRPRAQVLFTGMVGAVVGTHSGPGVFAFGMITE